MNNYGGIPLRVRRNSSFGVFRRVRQPPVLPGEENELRDKKASLVQREVSRLVVTEGL